MERDTGVGVVMRLVLRLARVLSARRFARGKVRALWGVTPILTLPLKARATNLLGMASTSLVFETYVITQAFDINLRRVANGAALLGPRVAELADRLILVWALLRFDVFHYFFDRGIMRPHGRFGIRTDELDLLRAAGKHVYAFAYGADVRRREATLALGRWNFCTECPEPGRYCVCDDESAKAAMDTMCSRLTAAGALGDMMAYVPGAHNLYYWPVDLAALPQPDPPRADRPLRIAHAPNHTHFKGSHHLEAAIKRLRMAGHAIEYLKVQGVPNHEVITLFRSADVVADQFIGGSHGYTALEAMALGKPVLAYVRSAEMVEAPHECPILNVAPDTLEETLLWLLGNRGRLPAIGAQGRAYVDRWHSISAVASRLGQLYRETGAFPGAIIERILEQRHSEEMRREAVPKVADWDHPFRLGSSSSPLVALGLYHSPSLSVETAIAHLSQPLEQRWWTARGEREPTDSWASYERAPWNHPWLTTHNISDFSRFSTGFFQDIRQELSHLESKNSRFAFVGNLANANYMRMAGLDRSGLDASLYLHPHDTAVMSQPAWEDFEGDIVDLGPEPAAAVMARALPAKVHRWSLDADWAVRLARGDAPFVDAADVLSVPEFMAHLPLYESAQGYDALLVSQTFAFGPLAHRPYIIAQTGGDIWFDPSRDDAFGRLTRRALHEAYAVLVSNPITFAHARRYGLKNCLYLPFSIDEERYHPGDEPEVRAEWIARTGGDFFVLTSMRIDNAWKGADMGLEGFARFSRAAPGARLVVLGWGADHAAVQGVLERLGIAEKVLLLPVVGKKRLARYLRAANALIEQFVLGYYGASALEALASGLPVVMRIERDQYEAMIPAGAPPVLDASTADQVCEQLARLASDSDFRAQVGTATRSWFMASHASAAAGRDLKVLLEAAARGLPVDWDASPLSRPLAITEVEWHSHQLAHAPAFPRYEL